METCLPAPTENRVQAILEAAYGVHRRLGAGWGGSICLTVLEIVLANRGVATVRCSLSVGRAGRVSRQEGLLCGRGTWVHVEGRVLFAAEVTRALGVARIERGVLLQFTPTRVEFRVLFPEGTVSEGPRPA